MISYQRVNIITGWIVFVFASAVYMLTAERTGSFWDCGEFVGCAYKLQVAHSPGAPFFLMLAHLFTMLAPDTTKVALMVNFMSALATAFTILFLFWTITHLAKKLIGKKQDEFSMGETMAVMGAGIIGALACTFADSMWFSAVEGEVYATSSFFTALGVWAILKWEDNADKPYSDRWLIFIGFIMGLSIGVHLLNLLTIPAIVFVYYFKKFQVTTWGVTKAFLVACGILGVVQYGIIPGLPKIAAKLDILFVNSFSLPFNSGVIFFCLLLVGGLTYGLWYSHKNGKYLLNTALLTGIFIIIGYSSYVMVVIRAAANPSLNMSAPKDPISLLSYLNREQYGDRPLVYGPVFTAQPTEIDRKNGAARYWRDPATKKYVLLDHKPVIKYDDADKMLFPRVWDNDDPSHITFYRNWLDLDEKEKPTFADNIGFFVSYQVGFMYWRYFMWNFSGRQNDVQGHGDIRNGNWITGIQAIDNARLGNQDTMPESMKHNKAHNKFFMLPFILGLIGAFFHFTRNKLDAWVTFLLFLFTGLAIVVYLNQTPLQPRERDYAYAGSDYAYTIWIGLGVMAVFEWLRKKLKPVTAAGLAFAICSIVPLLMGAQGWDDHDRSNRTTARDFGKNYLMSCPPNAILFTQGDNDTYPLWYAQEVENVRPDVRIVNLSLLGVDWYIDNLRRRVNESDAVIISIDSAEYRGSNHDYVRYYENKQISQDQAYSISDIMNFLFTKDKKKMLQDMEGDTYNYLPAKNIFIPINKQEVIADGVVQPSDTSKIVDRMQFTCKKTTLLKNDIMVLEILRSNLWKRPVCFAISVDPDSYLGIDNYMEQEGLVYRVVPYVTKQNDGLPGGVQADIMYDNVMNKFAWGGVDTEEDLYLDENVLRMVTNLRSNFSRLASRLIEEGKMDSAIKVLDKAVTVLPERNVPLTFLNLGMAENYIKAGAPDKGKEMADKLLTMYMERLAYFATLDKEDRSNWSRDINESLYILNEVKDWDKLYKLDDLAARAKEGLERYYPLYTAPSKGQ